MDCILCAAQTTPFLCFGLLSVRGKLNPANTSGLDFWNYTPLTTLIGPPIYINSCVAHV